MINEKACLDLLEYPCIFLKSSDKCEPVKDPNIDCSAFDTLGKVSAKACSFITKDGVTCSYDQETRLCKQFTKASSTCEVYGANANACYSLTSIDCRWNPLIFTCYEQEDKAAIATLGCNDYINKILCLKITLEPCEWNTAKMKCSKMIDLNISKFVASN